MTSKLEIPGLSNRRLKDMMPLSYWITFVYIMMNFIIGVTLFFSFDAGRVSAPLLIVNDVFTFKFWGILFVLTGIGQAVSLVSGRIELIRAFMLAGVAAKAAWAIALLVRIAISPGSALLALLWVALAVIQIVTVIFFVPPWHKSLEQRVDKEYDH